METIQCPKCHNLNAQGSEECLRCGADLSGGGTSQWQADMLVDNQYTLVRRIGEGGMGEVWQAVQMGIERNVAIKFMHSDLLRHPTAKKRVLNEARAMGRVDHPNVVRILQCFETNQTVALVLDYVDGGSLSEHIKKKGAIPPQEATQLAQGILTGLAELHAEGLIHRDIKPDNVLLATRGARTTPKITDLGIAHDEEGTRMTRAGSRLGTFEYMAPELFDSQAASVQSDLYAVGVTLYEMLAGDVPFSGSDASVMAGHCTRPPDLDRLPKAVPEWVRKVLAKSLAKGTDERFETAETFMDALATKGANLTDNAAATPKTNVRVVRDNTKKASKSLAKQSGAVASAKTLPMVAPTKGQSLGSYIRQARESRGLTRGQLAVAMGHKKRHQWIAQWEREETVPDTELLMKLAKALQLNEGHLRACSIGKANELTKSSAKSTKTGSRGEKKPSKDKKDKKDKKDTWFHPFGWILSIGAGFFLSAVAAVFLEGALEREIAFGSREMKLIWLVVTVAFFHGVWKPWWTKRK